MLWFFFLISWPFFSQTVSYFPSCQTARNHFCLTNSSSTEPYPNLGVTIRCKWEPGHRHRILYESEGSGGAKALTVTPIFLSQTSFCNFLVQFSAIMRSLQTQPWNSKWPTLKINWLKKKKKKDHEWKMFRGDLVVRKIAVICKYKYWPKLHTDLLICFLRQITFRNKSLRMRWNAVKILFLNDWNCFYKIS